MQDIRGQAGVIATAPASYTWIIGVDEKLPIRALACAAMYTARMSLFLIRWHRYRAGAIIILHLFIMDRTTLLDVDRHIIYINIQRN